MTPTARPSLTVAYPGGWPTQLQTALTEALAARAPALIHVPVAEMPSPWDMLTPTRVRGFHESWRPALP